MVLAHEPRVALRRDVVIAVLEVPAGLQFFKRTTVKPRPAVYAPGKVAGVDKVEVVGGPVPGKLGVLDQEAAVGGHPGWLDRGDVGADYLGGGEGIGDVSGGVLGWFGGGGSRGEK